MRPVAADNGAAMENPAALRLRYQQENITASEFADILNRSGLGARRPVEDLPRLQRMLDGATLLLTARDAQSGTLLGVSRALTDHAYACYLSDLAVDTAFQGYGIGRALVDMTRKLAGEESMCLLVAAPDAVGFYEKIGMPHTERAFLFPRRK
ncbi:GNAT family N-acetyltransferase [Xanthobacter sp. TB0139]|uniref:GNAT family N-acetyltransferase n=1 Tax=Xanthobacter sp. TB0139 TaxID=3459178 RepID=UPI0040392466